MATKVRNKNSKRKQKKISKHKRTIKKQFGGFDFDKITRKDLLVYIILL